VRLTRLAALPVLADSDAGKGSPIGLLVVLLLIVAVYFLYRSMNRHLRKIPGEFGRPAPDTQPPDAHSSTPDSQLPAPDTYPPAAEPSPPAPKQPEQDR
jgi:hypothetical protein